MFVYVGRISSFKHVLLSSKLHLSLMTFDETFSSFRTDWRHSTGSWKINEPSVAMDKEQGRDTIQNTNTTNRGVVALIQRIVYLGSWSV